MTLKQRDVRVWHFAHKADVDCAAAFEAALHALAKQILAEERYIRMPARMAVWDVRCSPEGHGYTRHAAFLFLISCGHADETQGLGLNR